MFPKLINFVKVTIIILVLVLGLYEIWDSFEIPYDDYEQYSAYLDHEFCGEMALDYASDGRVTIYELVRVEGCVNQGEKRDFYSKLEAK